MDLSLGFVLGSLLFLTPALVLIAALRVYYPIHRTISFLKHGLLLPAAALVISVVINGTLFLDYVTWSVGHTPELWKNVSPKTIELVAKVTQTRPHRPGQVLLELLGIKPATDYNILALILDVHLRVLIIAGATVVVFRLGVLLVDRIDSWWYVKRVTEMPEAYASVKSQRRQYDPRRWLGYPLRFAGYVRWWCLRKMVGRAPSSFIAEKSGLGWYNPRGWVQYVRDAVYHPWATLTSYNRHREILMVDVMCKDDNLYTGLFTSWTPDGEEGVSAVAMQYIVRYYPNPDGKGRRKIRFVENNGEMVFPMGEVSTVHFWELRRETDVLVTVRKESDLALAKYYLAVNEVNPGMLKKIVIEHQGDEGKRLGAELISWCNKRRLQLRNVQGVNTPAPANEESPPDSASPTPDTTGVDAPAP